MKRTTLGILISVVIFIAGLLAIWFLIVAPRLKPAPVVTPPPPTGTTTPPPPKTLPMHGALNLYLAAPETLPAGVVRAELTLVKATLVDDTGFESPVFQGAQRVMLQSGMVEKALSAQVGNTTWTHLKLEFSPAAEFSMSDGSTIAALVEQRNATLAFNADLPVSRSLELLARVPLTPVLKKVDTAWTADVSSDPVKADSYIFGSSMLDQRGMSNVWTVPQLSLPAVIKADLGLDITSVMPGSQGFSAAGAAPVPQAPPQ